jgi:hypothetical protein
MRGRAEKPRNGDTTLATNSQQAHDRAEASFKKKEQQGQKVNAVDDADRLAVREKTARLRALRLSRDATGTTLVKNTPRQGQKVDIEIVSNRGKSSAENPKVK